MMEVQWVDPPPTGYNGAAPGAMQEFVAELMKRPGDWALYPRPVTRPTATNNKARYPGTEWTTRIREDGKVDMYGRFVGP